MTLAPSGLGQHVTYLLYYLMLFLMLKSSVKLSFLVKLLLYQQCSPNFMFFAQSTNTDYFHTDVKIDRGFGLSKVETVVSQKLTIKHNMDTK